MTTSLDFLLSGLMIGLGAGITPGPLTLLVIQKTLQYNLKEGIKIAVVPLFTDLPIIGMTLILFKHLKNYHLALSLLSFLGAFFLIRMAQENWIAPSQKKISAPILPNSFWRGIRTNLLYPHPYLFWMSVGTPILFSGMKLSPFCAPLFIMSMLSSMVGIKILMGLLLKWYSHFFHGRSYLFLLRGTGLALFSFAMIFIREGIQNLWNF